MKKLLSIALIAVAFTLVGCAAEKYPASSVVTPTGFPKHQEKCKSKKCYRHGKLGAEKVNRDFSK